MPPTFRIVTGLAVLGLTLQPARLAGAKPREDEASSYERLAARTKRAAQEVLTAVLRDDRIEPTPCRFTMQWSNDPVGFEDAREYLGSHLYADLVTPHSLTQPSDLIDPNGKMRGSFCAENHMDALWKQMVADFKSGARSGEQDVYDGKAAGPYRLKLRRTDFTMPVLDKSFTSAVVKVLHSGTETWRMPSPADKAGNNNFNELGYYKRSVRSGTGYTYVYRLTKGRWKRIFERQDVSFH